MLFEGKSHMMKLMVMLQISIHEIEKKKFTINISSFLGANIENHEAITSTIKLIKSMIII